jgi:hypothetical protein
LISLGNEAKVRYCDGHFEIVEPGQYVLCAVTGQKIYIDRLKYWSVPLQEAYIDNQAALARISEPE